MPSLGIADPPAIAVHSPSRQLQTGKQIKYVPQAADAWINRITWCFIQDYSILKWFPTGSYDLSCLSHWFQEMSLLMNWYTSHPSYVNIILLVLWTRKGSILYSRTTALIKSQRSDEDVWCDLSSWNVRNAVWRYCSGELFSPNQAWKGGALARKSNEHSTL